MIGIFDSGLGGLTVFKEIINHNPGYDYIYLGDSARNPYGPKSQDLIYEYTKNGVSFLMEQGCHLVIIACNTASAKALRKLQQEWLPENYPERKILGVIIPTAEETIDLFNQTPKRKRQKKNKIGLIGTKATIQAQTFDQELKKINPSIRIYSQSSPLLVPLIEEGWLKRSETRKIIKHYLKPLKLKRINFLILGCTHYSILKDTIKEIIGKQCLVIDPPEPVAKKLSNYLKRHPELEQKISQNQNRIFYTTNDPEKFKQLGVKFLQAPIKKVELCSLE